MYVFSMVTVGGCSIESGEESCVDVNYRGDSFWQEDNSIEECLLTD